MGPESPGPGPAHGWPLARLVALAEDSPDAEVCGLLVRGRRGETEAWPVANVAGHPATAFELEPRALLRVLRELDGSGGQLVGVYHSHLAGGADLSARDLAGALADGAPILAGAAQLVVALEAGLATVIKIHRWSGREFEPSELWRRRGIPRRG